MAILIDQMVPFSNIDPHTSTNLWCKLIFQPLMAGFLSVGEMVYPISRNILVIQSKCTILIRINLCSISKVYTCSIHPLLVCNGMGYNQ